MIIICVKLSMAQVRVIFYLIEVIRGEDEVRECNVPLAFAVVRRKYYKVTLANKKYE